MKLPCITYDGGLLQVKIFFYIFFELFFFFFQGGRRPTLAPPPCGRPCRGSLLLLHLLFYTYCYGYYHVALYILSCGHPSYASKEINLRIYNSLILSFLPSFIHYVLSLHFMAKNSKISLQHVKQSSQ